MSLKKSLQPLPEIDHIDLSKNRIKLIDKETFKRNINLDSIKLNDNAITLIEDGSFDTVLDIQHLDLYNNELSSAGTYKARKINLNKNKLKSIYISEKTEVIQISNNYIEMINCTEKEMSVTNLQVSLLYY